LTGKPVIIENAQEDPRAQYPEEAKKEGIFTIVSIPMVIKGKVIGVLRMYTGERREFTQQEIDFVSSLAEMGAIAIENARIYERIRSDYESIMSDIYQYIGYRKSI
ncbi:MAG TPA: GAF domain-containing protein, partial [Deltaproteobacteria bacterium]|nr:GAF domain-containing protein [Deltaproteobacteria bacterium]